mgnify:CR=1 FL=1
MNSYEKINKKIQKLLIEATNHHKNNRLEDLEKVLRKIILIDPNYFPAFFNLARLFEMSKKFEEAIKLYKKTLEINPNHLESILNLINCYEDINELDKALKISEDSCKLHPDKYEVHYTLGRLTRKKGRNLDKAYNAYKKTLSINSNFKFAKIGLGQIYKSKGNFSEAKKTFQKIIDYDGNEIRAYYEIADFLNDKEIKKNIKSLKILENDNKQKYGNKIYLYFTMGKLFEKINKYDKAIHYYNLGNNLKRKQINYSIDYDEKKFDALKKTIDKFGANKKRNIGHKSSRPIFIVGMPRSGTTLIEQIVSSHSKVFGGGELLFFTNIFQKELNLKKNKDFLEILKNLTEKNFFDLIIIGAGFAGMYALYKAKQHNLSVRVFEKASGVGGTWYWNRYPGARCDVESMQYSYQFSKKLEQEWEWKEQYATQAEILKYAEHVAERYNLKPSIKFNETIISAPVSFKTSLTSFSSSVSLFPLSIGLTLFSTQMPTPSKAGLS